MRNYLRQIKNYPIGKCKVADVTTKDIVDHLHYLQYEYKKKDGKIVPILDDNKEYHDVVAKFQGSSIEIMKKYLEYIDYFDYLMPLHLY